MAKTTGTTTGSNAVNDLLGKFRTWLTVTIASPWTEEEFTAGATDTDVATLSVRGPGAGADRRVFINMRTENSGGHQGIEMNGAVAYSSSLTFETQQNASPSKYLNLDKDVVMNYWFYANDRRFLIIAKVSTSYVSCHGGFFLPFATPEEYPFPLYVAATMAEIEEASSANTRSRHIIDPGFGAAHYLRRGTQDWVRVSNHGSVASTVSVDTKPDRFAGDAVMWPHGIPASWTDSFDDWNSQGKGFSRWRRTPGVKATGILTLAANAADTETVVIDTKTYTFQDTLTDVDGNVHIGASASDTIDNLIAAIILGAGAGTDYATSMTLHPTVTAAAGAGDTMDATAKVVGIAGNSIATTETLAAGGSQWGAATLLGGRNQESPVFQCHIIDPGAGVVPGAIDGVFGAVGDGRTAESTSTDGGKTYIYFQNTTRSGHRNIMAIEDV